jgi:CopG family nickel-responsive transcriptional regulator
MQSPAGLNTVRKSDRNPSQARVTLSLPAQLLEELDRVGQERGFANRSQAAADLLAGQLAHLAQDDPHRVMAGTLSLTYDRRRHRCQSLLAELQRVHIKEVVASLRVQLEDDQTLEVMVMQGPAGVLRRIADAMTALKGVSHGSLNLTTSILPPLHANQNGAEVSAELGSSHSLKS